MLTLEQRKWFIDPLPDPMAGLGAERILATASFNSAYRGYANLNKVVNVRKDKRHESLLRLWYIDEDGNYIDGPSVNTIRSGYTIAMGIISDDLFVIGETTYDFDDSYMILRNCMRSDQKVLPGADYSGVTMRVDTWVQVASWARELMPLPTDTPDAVSAKLNLAKQKWEQRHAKIEVIRQACQRGWDEHFVPLQDDHDFPKPHFGANVSANILVPVNNYTSLEDQPRRVASQIEAITARSSTTPDLRATSVEVNVTYPSRSALADSRHGLQDLPDHIYMRDAQDYFQNTSLRISNRNTAPILRSTS